jgi:hypothetical protein
VIRDLSIVLVVFVAAAVVGLTLTMVYAITSSVLTGVVGSSLVMTSSEAIGTFSVAL